MGAFTRIMEPMNNPLYQNIGDELKLGSLKRIDVIQSLWTLFSISNANAGGCSSHTEKKAEIECLSDDKNCIEAKEKESLYKVEA